LRTVDASLADVLQVFVEVENLRARLLPMSSPDSNPNPSPDSDSNKREEVHFYPGDKLLLYYVNDKIVLRAEAWGGPSKRKPRLPGESIAAGPTLPGTFIIDHVESYRTSTWDWSKVRWGTRIRKSQRRSTQAEYELSSGKWASLTRDFGIGAKDIETAHRSLFGYDKFPDRWIFNDFGPIAVRYYRDRNANRQRDASEPLMGQMLHTTPSNEAQWIRYPEDASKVELAPSHGCIHIKPIDRDAFLEAGAFRPGMTLIVFRYHEHFTGKPESESR